MKCYLQSNGEKCSENEFAALYHTQKDSYRHAGIRRLEAGPPPMSARTQIELQGFRKAEWRLAFNQALDVDDLGAPAFADEVQFSKPRKPVVCEVVQTAVLICTKPCTTWANSQPDFQYSLDACVADNRKHNPCVGVELQVR
jgi:hypothetical protein